MFVEIPYQGCGRRMRISTRFVMSTVRSSLLGKATCSKKAMEEALDTHDIARWSRHPQTTYPISAARKTHPPDPKPYTWCLLFVSLRQGRRGGVNLERLGERVKLLSSSERLGTREWPSFERTPAQSRSRTGDFHCLRFASNIPYTMP